MRKLRKKKSPKRKLELPDLEQAKSAVLNSLTSISGKRSYGYAITEFVRWYCSEPRLAFNRTVVLRYRIHLEPPFCRPVQAAWLIAYPWRPGRSNLARV